jgi:hypothetical protein
MVRPRQGYMSHGRLTALYSCHASQSTMQQHCPLANLVEDCRHLGWARSLKQHRRPRLRVNPTADAKQPSSQALDAVGTVHLNSDLSSPAKVSIHCAVGMCLRSLHSRP